jgi:hypothetical protein
MPLLTQALKELNNVPVGTEFTVKDLFLGYYWNSLPRTERLTLGTLFLHAIQTNPSIEKIHKNSANQQLYKKI